MAPGKRGASRGGSRGRGSSRRGRGGARAPAGRRGRRPAQRTEKKSSDTMQVEDANVDIGDVSENVKSYFLKLVPFEAHLAAQEVNKYRYLATMVALTKNKVELLQGAKIRALAAAWARHDHELANTLLQDSDNFGVVEVLKSLQMLDAGRKGRAEEKRFAQLKRNALTAGKKGKSRLGRKIMQVKLNINNLGKLKPTKGTVSGALCRTIKRWTRGLDKDKLEFFALHMPTETWKQLADICHLNPEKDFPTLPWFLKYCFNRDSVPEGTLVHKCQGLNADNVNEHVAGVDVPYSHIKPLAAKLTDASKARIAAYTPDLDTLLWNYEDLSCQATDDTILRRLQADEAVSLPYGKLMERLLMMRKRQCDQVTKGEPVTAACFYDSLMPRAEAILGTVSVSVEAPVVVIGDASSSMDVAIQTSTIIASFLRALTSAQLVFFSNDLIEPPFIPSTIKEVIELALAVKTVASTCHAAGLWPYYEKKQIVKTFIVTTDEEENMDYVKDGHNWRFLELFERYHAEVYPARLVFVSFLHNQHEQGQMVGPLLAKGFNVLQFKLDHNRPDLNKLNNLVGQLALQANNFNTQVTELENELRSTGMQSVFNRLRLIANPSEQH